MVHSNQSLSEICVELPKEKGNDGQRKTHPFGFGFCDADDFVLFRAALLVAEVDARKRDDRAPHLFWICGEN